MDIARQQGQRRERDRHPRIEKGRRVVAEPWRDDELILVGAEPDASLDDPVVTFLGGSTTRGLLERHFPEARVAVELSGIAAIKQHLRLGIGVAWLTRIAVARDLETGQLHELAHPRTPIPRHFAIAHRGLRRLSPAAARLREVLRDHAQLAPSDPA